MKKVILISSLFFSILLQSLESLKPLYIQHDELRVYSAIRTIAHHLEKEFGGEFFATLEDFSGERLDVKSGVALHISDEGDFHTVKLITPWGAAPAVEDSRKLTDADVLSMLNFITVKPEQKPSDGDEEFILEIDGNFYGCPELTFHERDLTQERKQFKSEITVCNKQKWHDLRGIYNLQVFCGYVSENAPVAQ